MSKCDVCYIVSLGLSARMILHTDLIKEMKKAGLNNIALVFPGKIDKSFEHYEQNFGIKTYFADFKNSIWSNEYMNFRRYVYEDIRNNPALLAKHVKSIFEYKGINPWRKIKPYFYYTVNKISEVLSFSRPAFSKLEQFILKNRNLRKLIKEIDPKIIVSTYPVNYIEGAAINTGRSLGITTITHLLSWDNITCKGRFPALSDYYISWGQIMKDELQEYYNIPSEKIFNTGVPHFDKSKELVNSSVLKTTLDEMGLNSKMPYILVGMSSPYFSPREIDIVERLADLIIRNIFGTNMQLVIRPHPQNVEGEMSDVSWLTRLKKLECNRVGIDYPIVEKSHLPWNTKENDLKKLSNLIAGCTVLINSGSTISIEGLIHNKPVILTLFDGDSALKDHNSARRLRSFFHLQKLINTRSVKLAFHYEELKQSLISYIQDPSQNSEERGKALKLECGEIDGKSSARIAGIFAQLTNKCDRELSNN
jgi:hypothetical protein